MNCPNCGVAVAEESAGCVLHAFIQVIRERGDMNETELQQLHANTDVDDFWNEVGLVVDDLENGRYLNEDQS